MCCERREVTLLTGMYLIDGSGDGGWDGKVLRHLSKYLRNVNESDNIKPITMCTEYARVRKSIVMV